MDPNWLTVAGSRQLCSFASYCRPRRRNGSYGETNLVRETFEGERHFYTIGLHHS